jgi:hypothetical protein
MRPIDNNKIIATRALRTMLSDILKEIQLHAEKISLTAHDMQSIIKELKIKDDKRLLQALSDQEISEFITKALKKNKSSMSKVLPKSIQRIPKEAAKLFGVKTLNANGVFNANINESLEGVVTSLQNAHAKLNKDKKELMQQLLKNAQEKIECEEELREFNTTKKPEWRDDVTRRRTSSYIDERQRIFKKEKDLQSAGITLSSQLESLDLEINVLDKKIKYCNKLNGEHSPLTLDILLEKESKLKQELWDAEREGKSIVWEPASNGVEQDVIDRIYREGSDRNSQKRMVLGRDLEVVRAILKPVLQEREALGQEYGLMLKKQLAEDIKNIQVGNIAQNARKNVTNIVQRGINVMYETMVKKNKSQAPKDKIVPHQGPGKNNRD